MCVCVCVCVRVCVCVANCRSIYVLHWLSGTFGFTRAINLSVYIELIMCLYMLNTGRAGRTHRQPRAGTALHAATLSSSTLPELSIGLHISN